MATTSQAAPPLPSLDERIAAHKVAVARFRAEHGDPAEALHNFMREAFDEEALIQTYLEYLAEERLGTEYDGGSESNG